MTKNIRELHEDFMSESRYLARLSPATLHNYQATFDLFIKLIPEVSLAMLTGTTLAQFFKELETRKRIVGRGRLKQGVKESTIATYRAKLAPFFNWLKRKGYITESPFSNLPQPRVVYEEPQYLRKEQIERIITAIDFKIPWPNLFLQKRNMAIITTLLFGGLRKSELLNLKVYDIDLERSEMKINASTSKSKQHKTLPLNSLVRRKLEDYLAERKKKGHVSPYLFTSDQHDERLSDEGLRHLIKRISEQSGVKFHLHQLRHTFAVNLINQGTDVTVVQKLMGHKSISATLIYLRCIPSATMRQGVEALQWESLV